METLENKIAILEEQIADKQNDIDCFELDGADYESSYDEMLDDCYPEVFNILPSRILSECDPIGYRCGLSDYLDGLEVSNDPNYQELEEELEELQTELEELEEELENIES